MERFLRHLEAGLTGTYYAGPGMLAGIVGKPGRPAVREPVRGRRLRDRHGAPALGRAGLMAVTDVWVELPSEALSVRMVWADTIEQV
ncbi:hypothetical protein [Streptomyces sp. NPDC057696]|uniref:hypothetical protein n=1 Tax=Streptomyces sp. NPDC057696 TaxID=3346218 RepID=UPI0036A8C8B1